MALPVENQTSALQQSVQHPLDPLTAAEVEKTTRILRASGRITPRVRIMAYSLLEPAKDSVLAFQPGQPVQREVFVVMRDHERRLTIEAIVLLAEETIRSWRERTDVQPALTYPEVFAAQQAVLANAAFQDAMSRRGILDLSSVVIYPWTAGYRGPEDAASQGRFMRMEVALAEGPGDNYYAHPVEGVIATIELDSMTVSIEDHGVVPVPTSSGNYTQEGIRAAKMCPHFQMVCVPI